jgi:membrane fusion protein, heavy metal efflux system
MRINWKLSLAVVLIASGATGIALNPWTRAHVVDAWKQLAHSGSHSEAQTSDKSWLVASTNAPQRPWNRILTLTSDEIRAIGLKTEIVKNQTEPTVLRLFGATDYDPATVTVVRTQFDSRVEEVLVDFGNTVKVDTPLLKLFSTELAEAKSNYEAAISQWARDNKVLEYKTELAKTNNLAKKELIEAENDEAQSRLKKKLARDKLLVYGLTDKEIENASKEDGVQKAQMILRSRAAGVVVLRNVVKGNYYTSADLLMTIAPLDHLWVRGSVSELDAEKVEVGQKLTVVFPYSDRTVEAEVTYVDKAIDPESRSAKFRTTIRNPDGKLKAGMSVRVLLKIPPKTGRTTIPRSAMVTVDRFDYVFIKKAGTADQFARRQIFTANEMNDVVIVAEPSRDHQGLAPGQEVVTIGSLILEELYEEREMTEGGFLVSRDGESKVASRDQSNVSIVIAPVAASP